MWVMYDSTEPGVIPRNAPAVAGYVGGSWPTFSALEKGWPHAHRLSIAVNAHEDATCLDIENGDAVPADAPAWFRRQKARGVLLPVFYASLSPMPDVLRELERAGIQRHEYLTWAADYTHVPHIPKGCDACQWTDRALGRNLDESLCTDAFFRPPAAPAYVPADEHGWIKEWDMLRGHRSFAAHRRRVALKRRMVARRRSIYKVAESQRNGWNVLNRLARYEALKARTR